jgi:hypothetical protein
MPLLRLEGPDYSLLHTTLPEQALDAQNRRFTLPNHIPAQSDERCLLNLDVVRAGTTIVSQWLPEGQKFLARRRPNTPAGEPRVIFHAVINQVGRYCVFADVPRSYNCHWVLWMHHDDCQPYRFRCVWALQNYYYRQEVIV